MLGTEPSVLLITDSTGVGGMELHVLRLAKALAARQPQCRVACVDAAPTYVQRLRDAEVPFEDLALGRLGFRWLRGLLRLRHLLRQAEPQVIQLYGFTSELLSPALRLFAPRSMVLSCRRGQDECEQHNRWRRLLNCFCDALVCVSEETAAHVIESEKVAPAKIVVVPNGVSVPAREAELSVSKALLRFGSIGNVKPVKGTDILVNAFLRFDPHAAVELHVAGAVGSRVRDREWALDVVRTAKNSSARNRITFCGYREDTAAFLRDIDVFVLPSRSEGMSNALLEAMAYGLPCIATDVGSNRGVLTPSNGEAVGLVCRPDSEDLFEAMNRLYLNPELRATLALLARERVIQSFSEEAMVANYRKLYSALPLSNRGDRHRRFAPRCLV